MDRPAAPASSAVNGSGPMQVLPGRASRANSAATSAVSGIAASATSQAHESRRHQPVQHARKPDVPLELRLEYEEPEIDRDGRSGEDQRPSRAGGTRARTARRRAPGPRGSRPRCVEVVVDEVGGDQSPVLARPGWRRGRSAVPPARRPREQLQRDQHAARARAARATCAGVRSCVRRPRFMRACRCQQQGFAMISAIYRQPRLPT